MSRSHFYVIANCFSRDRFFHRTFICVSTKFVKKEYSNKIASSFSTSAHAASILHILSLKEIIRIIIVENFPYREKNLLFHTYDNAISSLLIITHKVHSPTDECPLKKNTPHVRFCAQGNSPLMSRISSLGSLILTLAAKPQDRIFTFLRHACREYLILLFKETTQIAITTEYMSIVHTE